MMVTLEHSSYHQLVVILGWFIVSWFDSLSSAQLRSGFHCRRGEMMEEGEDEDVEISVFVTSVKKRRMLVHTSLSSVNHCANIVP